MVWDVAFVGIKVSQVPLLVRIDLRASSGASAGSAVKAERDGPVLGSLRLAEARLGRDPLAGIVQVIFMSIFINVKAIEIHEFQGNYVLKLTFFPGSNGLWPVYTRTRGRRGRWDSGRYTSC